MYLQRMTKAQCECDNEINTFRLFQYCIPPFVIVNWKIIITTSIINRYKSVITTFRNGVTLSKCSFRAFPDINIFFNYLYLYYFDIFFHTVNYCAICFFIFLVLLLHSVYYNITPSDYQQ